MKPKIVFFISGLAVGGAERHTLDLRARLRERGFDTELLVFGPRRSPEIVNIAGAEDPICLNIIGMSRPLGWLKGWRELRKLDADLVVGVNQTPLIVAVVLRLLGSMRSKVACVFHTTLLRGDKEISRFFLFRWAIRRADALIYISRNQKAHWEANALACPSTPLILNGIDFGHFAPVPEQRVEMRQRLGLRADEILVSLVAAFRPEKNHLLLVDAVAALRKRGVPLRLLFVGDGPTFDSVKAGVTQAGIEDAVIFAGMQSDVRPWIMASDIGVLCSYSETFSLAAIEFLACGVPMLMSDVGGASEIVKPGLNGYLFALDKEGDLVAKLETMSDGVELDRLKADSRASVAALSVEHMVDQYAALFETMTGKKASPGAIPDFPPAKLRWDSSLIKRWSGDRRAPERIIEHYELERRLAARLKNSTREERASLYAQVYSELFASLPDHPQNTASRDSYGQRLASQLSFLGHYLTPESRYVEIGCGDAALGFALAGQVGESIGVDVTPALVNHEAAPANFRFVKSDGIMLDLPTASVDIVYSNQLMEHIHVDDVEDQVADIARVLKPGGVYICATPHRLLGPTDISKYFDETPTGFHMKEYDFNGLREIFTKAGFSSVDFVIASRGRIFARPSAFVFHAAEKLASILPSFLRRMLIPLMRPVLGMNAIARR